LVGWVIFTGWTDSTTRVTPGERGLQIGFREPAAHGVDPSLAVATLYRSLPYIMGADEAWIFGVYWENRGKARVRMDIANNK